MDYSILQAELVKPAYIGKTDQQAADILNVKQAVFLGLRTLDAVEVLDAIGQSKVAQIQDAAVEATAKGHVAAAAWDAYLSMTGKLVVAPGSGGRAVLDALAVDRLLDVADVTNLEALARNVAQMSQAQVLGLPFVGAHHIALARSM